MKHFSLVAIATRPPPPVTPTAVPDTTSEVIGVPDNLFGTLRAWEFGLIIGVVSLIIVVLLLGGAVWMGRLTIKRRRDNKRRSRVQYRKATPTQRPLYLSMIEEIQMMEEENVETVDIGGN